MKYKGEEFKKHGSKAPKNRVLGYSLMRPALGRLGRQSRTIP